jgi:hypothetical protein
MDRGVTLTSTVSVQRDTNVLRLEDGQQPADVGLAGSSRADTIVSPVIQLDILGAFSRQKLYASATWRDTRFDRFSQFDTDSLDYRGGWSWTLGPALTGEISGGREKQNTSFEDFFGPRRNVLTIRTVHADLGWRPRPDRRLALSADAYDGRNSESERRGGDYATRAVRIELAAASTGQTEAGLGFRQTDAEYPNPVFFFFTRIGNNYQQRDADLFVRLRGERRLRAELRAGYAWRRYDEITERNVEGPNGLISLSWAATGKIQVEASAARDFSAVEDFDNLYTVADRERLTARYVIRPQWALSAEFKRRKLSYRGDPAQTFFVPEPSAERRVDRSSEQRWGLTWLPSNAWIFDLSYVPQRRESTIAGLQFRSEAVQFVAQYRVRT